MQLKHVSVRPILAIPDTFCGLCRCLTTMTSLYVFLQWARPLWLLILFASAVSVGLLLMVLASVHTWLADQFFTLEEAGESLEADEEAELSEQEEEIEQAEHQDRAIYLNGNVPIEFRADGI